MNFFDRRHPDAGVIIEVSMQPRGSGLLCANAEKVWKHGLSFLFIVARGILRTGLQCGPSAVRFSLSFEGQSSVSLAVGVLEIGRAAVCQRNDRF